MFYAVATTAAGTAAVTASSIGIAETSDVTGLYPVALSVTTNVSTVITSSKTNKMAENAIYGKIDLIICWINGSKILTNRALFSGACI